MSEEPQIQKLVLSLVQAIYKTSISVITVHSFALSECLEHLRQVNTSTHRISFSLSWVSLHRVQDLPKKPLKSAAQSIRRKVLFKLSIFLINAGCNVDDHNAANGAAQWGALKHSRISKSHFCLSEIIGFS